MASEARTTPGYYSRSLDGHRASYLGFVTRRFGGRRVTASEAFGWNGPVLFLMIEESFALYAAVAIWRSMLGLRTAGLLFRPGPAVEAKSWRLRLKRALLRGLRRVPHVQTLSIVPVPLAPSIGSIVDGWIHDFQLWDLSESDRLRFQRMRHARGSEESTQAGTLLAVARRHANGRRLLVALGMQNRGKGIELLAASMLAGGMGGWAVLVAGRFAPEAASARDVIQKRGGLVFDRFMADDEILALYAAADSIWCLYDPAYDQASGILGRAIQLGVPPIVRAGSFSEAFCGAEAVVHAAAEGGADLAAALAAIPCSSDTPSIGGDVAARMADASDLRLRQALALAPG